MKYDLTRLIDWKTFNVEEVVNLSNADKPDPSALFFGSCIMEGGFGLLPGGVDDAWAVEWARRGAEAEDAHPLCRARYGLLRYADIGVVMDPKVGSTHVKASKDWITVNAINGNPYAQSILGLFHLYGYGVKNDRTAGLEWLEKAAGRDNEKGEVFAQYNLGTCFDTGFGVKKDFVEAKRWFTRATDQEYVRAQIDVGYALAMNGQLEEAREMWMKAAGQKHIAAYHYLGGWYAGSFGSTPDHVQAYEWFSQSAQQGFRPSLLEVANCLSEGIGVEQNRAEALSLYMDLLTRRGKTIDTVPFKAADQRLIEQKILKLKMAAKTIKEDGKRGWAFEGADGATAIVWESPSAPRHLVRGQRGRPLRR